MQEKENINLYINNILENVINNETTFLKISKVVEKDQLRFFLNKKQEQSCKDGIALKNCFLDLNFPPISATSKESVQFKKWIDAKEILKIADDSLFINRLIESEVNCATAYTKLLHLGALPKKLENLLVKQKENIENNIVELRLYEGRLF
ncbi:hypothetical protein N9V96_02550 [Polaribacter sp.]|nr:hypothetical protein [Polaribacter sp.]